MTALLAFICFVIATTIFLLRAAFEVAASTVWGLVFVAAGLAFMCISGAYAWGRDRTPS